MARDTLDSLRRRLRAAARSRNELERRMFHLKTLYELSRDIGPLIDIDQILKNLLMMGIGTLGAVRGVITLVDTATGALQALSQMGLDEAARTRLAGEAGALKDRTAFGGIRRLRKAGRRRSTTQPRLLDVLSSLELRIWIPFEVEGSLAGGIALGEKLSGDDYRPEDDELLATIANQGSVALKNAITHQEVVRYAADLEASLRRIQILESIRSNLAKFVPMAVQQLIEESPQAPSFDKRELDVSVLFADISSYTRVSAELPLGQVNRLVERYFGAFLDEILRRGGDVNETAGDGLMVIFRNPEPRLHARAAVLAALAIQRRTQEINAEHRGELPAITMKVGVNSGIASVGATKIEGTAGLRWTYTASGPTTNIAARLAALDEGGAVVVTQETRDRLDEEFLVEDLGLRHLKNVMEPTRVYRVTRLVSEPGRPVWPDQRRHPRRSASARVRVWIDDHAFEGKLVEAGAHGLRVTGIPGGLFTIRGRYRISVEIDPCGEFVCVGEVRHIGDDGVGLETSEAVPDLS
jgi:class 3 adenylate cyclase